MNDMATKIALALVAVTALVVAAILKSGPNFTVVVAVASACVGGIAGVAMPRSGE